VNTRILGVVDGSIRLFLPGYQAWPNRIDLGIDGPSGRNPRCRLSFEPLGHTTHAGLTGVAAAWSMGSTASYVDRSYVDSRLILRQSFFNAGQANLSNDRFQARWSPAKDQLGGQHR